MKLISLNDPAVVMVVVLHEVGEPCFIRFRVMKQVLMNMSCNYWVVVTFLMSHPLRMVIYIRKEEVKERLS